MNDVERVDAVAAPGNSAAGRTTPRWLVLILSRRHDTSLLVANATDLASGKTGSWAAASLPPPQVNVSRWKHSSEAVLHGNVSLRFPWSFECSEANGLSGTRCAAVATRPLEVCAAAADVERALEDDLPGVGDVTVTREVTCGVRRWNGTLLEAVHRRCRYEVEFHDVVSWPAGATAVDDAPWTWQPTQSNRARYTQHGDGSNPTAQVRAITRTNAMPSF